MTDISYLPRRAEGLDEKNQDLGYDLHNGNSLDADRLAYGQCQSARDCGLEPRYRKREADKFGAGPMSRPLAAHCRSLPDPQAPYSPDFSTGPGVFGCDRSIALAITEISIRDGVATR